LTRCANEDRTIGRARQCIPARWRCTAPNQGARFVELGQERTAREVARAQIRRAAEIPNDDGIIRTREVHVHAHEIKRRRAELLGPKDIAISIQLDEPEVVHAHCIHCAVAEVYRAIEVERDVHVSALIENARYGRRNISAHRHRNRFAPRRIALAILLDDVQDARLSRNLIKVACGIDDASERNPWTDVENDRACRIVFDDSISGHEIAIAEVDAAEVVRRNRRFDEQMPAIAGGECRDFDVFVDSTPSSRVNRRGVDGIAIAMIPMARRDDIGVTSSSAEVCRFIVRVIDRRISHVRGTTRGVERKRPRLFTRRIGCEHPAIHIDGTCFSAISGDASIGKRREPFDIDVAVRSGRKNGGPLERSVWRGDVGAKFVVTNVAHALEARGAWRAAVGLAKTLSVASAGANRRRIRVVLALRHG
jgi:hypothetical protein